MAEAVGSALRLISRRRTPSRYRACAAFQPPKTTTPRMAAALSIRSRAESNYFDTDFLNMRSIFSFVASQQAWLA